MQEARVVQALAALAHPMRLRVFRALVVAGPAGLTPGSIQASIGVPPTTLSFHLKELATAGLASVERAGRSLVYRAAYEEMNRLLAYLTRNCCEGAACVAAPAKTAAMTAGMTVARTSAKESARASTAASAKISARSATKPAAKRRSAPRKKP